jgi:hypothetical protein
MTKKQAIYWRTEAGLRAWACSASGLPRHYRTILGIIEGPTPVESIRAGIREHSEKDLFAWLDELDTLGFIETAHSAVATNAQLADRSVRWLDQLEAA